jgi:hypothetical protein
VKGYYYLVTNHGTLRRNTDLERALRWFEVVPDASHMIGPTGCIVADRRAATCGCGCHAWDGVPHRRRCKACGHLDRST